MKLKYLKVSFDVLSLLSVPQGSRVVLYSHATAVRRDTACANESLINLSYFQIIHHILLCCLITKCFAVTLFE